MSSESLQHKLDRVRPPRVQITYDVETNGAMQKVELPLVVGVLAGLSGHPDEPLPPLKERRFVPIDRDNFNQVLAKAAPRLALKVPNRLTDDNSKLGVELRFRHLEDFEPARVAEQVPPLCALLKLRRKLTQLLSKMEGKDKLERLLAEVLDGTVQAWAQTRKPAGNGSASPTETPQLEESK